MEWENIYHNVAGEALLEKLPDGASCDTNFARVTLRREAGVESRRLAITSLGESLPEAQAQPNDIAARAARQIQDTEDWIAVLERADIHVQGSSTELRCSVLISEADLQGRSEGFRDGVVAVANNIVNVGLNSLLGVELPTPELR